MEGNETVQLCDVCVKIGSGATPRGGKEAYKGGATSLIRSQNIYNEGFHRNGLVYIDDDQSAELRNVEVMPNDVLLNITGDSVARCCQVAQDVLPARVNQHVAIIRPEPNSLDARFLRYVLVSQEYQSRLLALASAGATRPALTKSMIEELDIPSPPLAEQKAIASILGALDDKIELNRRMNATLEGMARAMFQSWFVDFDPVRAKLDGRKPEGLDKATAALFPDAFEESSIGHIPKGWKIDTLGSILDVLETGRRPKGGVGSYTSGVPSVGAESINGIGVFDYSKTKYIPHEFFEKTSSGRVVHFDVLLYKDGGKPGEFRPRVGLFGHDFPFKTFCINEHVFRMRSVKTGQSFLFFTTSHQRVLDDFANKGGKAAIPGINQPDVKSTLIVLPPKEIIDMFNARADLLCDQILQNAIQSRTLANLRDTLLPKLLSGELSVASTKVKA